MKLIIDGFKTKQQVECFWDWYAGQGEQDATIWFECREADGELDVTFMPSNVWHKNFWQDDSYNVEVTINE